MRIFIFIYFFCFQTLNASLAQYQNVWCFGGQNSSTQTGSGLSFSEFPPKLFTTAVQSNLTSNSVSDSTGSLLFYNDGFRVFNKLHQVMENGDSLSETTNDGYNSSNTNIVIQTQPKTYILLNCNNDLTYSLIDFNTNELGKVTYKNVLLKKLISLQHNTICIDAYPVKGEQNNFWLVADTRDTAFVYKVTNNGILYYNHFLHVNKAYVTNANIKFSHDGKLLVKSVYTDTALGATVFFNDFDPVSGIMSNERSLKLASFAPVYPYDSIYYGGPSHCEFSPNDSIIYFTCSALRIFPANLFRITQLNRYNINQVYHFTVTGPGGMIKLAPDGRIYILNNHINIQNYFIIIPKPNLWGEACKIYVSKLKSTIKNMGTSHQRGLPGGYSAYKRLEYYAYNTCNKSKGMAFQNVSDTTFYKTYNWFWGDGDSLTNQPYKPEVHHTYATSGKYFVKLKAISEYGYTMWFTDTVEYIKPPVAQFNFATDTGCQWIALQFNSSSLNDYKSLTWHWSFGDGKFDTIQHPAHIYGNSGTYTIQLVVNNTVCSDTLTIPNTIFIQPAPKPGFTISSISGCAPHTVSISDTAKWLVLQKEYFTEDNQQWRVINTASWNHTINTPGRWKIIQRLSGITGCITYDSVYVNVRGGFNHINSDIALATYTSQNKIELFWPQRNGAKSYEIWHGNVLNQYHLLSTVQDTFYLYTPNLKSPQENYFKIIPVDSCGNKDANGQYSKPMLLQGTSYQNEYAELNFSPYEGWASGVKEYRIETVDKNGKFKLQGITLEHSLFKDTSFWMPDRNEQCYRIIGIQLADTNIQSSSNIVCFDYVPELFIPDAFSPNGDNINDEFMISSVGITDFELIIFNLWGQKILHTNDKNFKWQGLNSPNGVYTYILYARNIQNKSISKRGTITLGR